ncbi:MAG: hypothetical protein FWG10_11095 [Eubacteriaceae bacterium]|nr:hypothetical protein [Eubacteriaceae bacterium]
MDNKTKVFLGVAAASAVSAGISYYLSSSEAEKLLDKGKQFVSNAVSEGVEKAADSAASTLRNAASKIDSYS